MACIEGFFIYNAKGDPIIYRLYRNDVSLRVVSDIFRTRVLHFQAQLANSAPVCASGDLTLAHITSRDIFLVAAVRNNANVMMCLQWLNSLVQLFTQYFKKVKEKYIRANFVLIYELLDEVCDNGVPQITDPLILKNYVFQEGTFVSDKKEQDADDVMSQVTGAVGHRNPRTVYTKNEVYLDIVETMDVLMAPDGEVLRSEVNGRLLMKAFLSGMPECRLGLNMHGRDCTFSSIVSQSDWDTQRSISFVPPDNANKTEFEIMRYCVSDQLTVPFKLISNVTEISRTRVSVELRVKALFAPSLAAHSIVLKVPVPPQTAKVKIKKSKGDAKYDGAVDAIKWNIAKFRGHKEHSLSADVMLVPTTREQKVWNKPPVTMQFHVPMFSSSPLRVVYLRIHERSGYQVDKWVRKVCNAGNYHCKIK